MATAISTDPNLSLRFRLSSVIRYADSSQEGRAGTWPRSTTLLVTLMPSMPGTLRTKRESSVIGSNPATVIIRLRVLVFGHHQVALGNGLANSVRQSPSALSSAGL